MLAQSAQSLQTVMCPSESHTRRQTRDVTASLVDVAEHYNRHVSLFRAEAMAHNLTVCRRVIGKRQCSLDQDDTIRQLAWSTIAL